MENDNKSVNAKNNDEKSVSNKIKEAILNIQIPLNFFRDALLSIGSVSAFLLFGINYFIIKYDLLHNYPVVKELSTSYLGGLVTAIIATVITSIIYKLYYDQKVQHEKENNEKMLIKTMMESVELHNIYISGFRKTFENISDNLENIHKNALNAKEIRIMSTYLEEPIFSLHNLTEFAKKGCTTLKILLLSPDSKVVELREANIKNKTLNKSMKEQIQSVLDSFKKIEFLVNDNLKVCKDDEKKFSITARTYDFFPPFFLILCDNSYAVVGFYWHNNRATARTMFELVGEHSTFIQSLSDEFDEIFKSNSLSKPHNLDNIL
jgi:hypothetical protein